MNAGLSVSRVGGKAQSRSFRQVSGLVRLELAQFQSLAAFSQFGSDLDEATQKRITRGKRIVEILKQPQFTPMGDLAQIVSIHAAGSGLLDEVPLEKMASSRRGSWTTCGPVMPSSAARSPAAPAWTRGP